MIRSFIVLFVLVTICSAQEGQKAHFQVHNKKQGDLEIHATKDKAEIIATADSVQMVVDPGQQEVPVGIQTPVERKRIFNIVGPDVSGLKRSLTDKEASRKRISIPLRKRNILRKNKNVQTKHFKTVNGVKKSEVKEMRVHGQNGRLHVHTDHNSTTLNSESGNLEIYIKNPDHADHEKETAAHQTNVHVKIVSEISKKDTFHHLPIHIAEDVTGLKKSTVNVSTKLKGATKR